MAKTEKEDDAYRTISEISTELDVPQHVLRFWETKFDELQPLKRNGRRRYYRPEDRDLLLGIRDLLYVEGFTIRGVQKLLAQGIRGPQDLKADGTGPAQSLSEQQLPSLDLSEPAPDLPPAQAALARVAKARAGLQLLIQRLE